jgi:hypothetical protein
MTQPIAIRRNKCEVVSCAFLSRHHRIRIGVPMMIRSGLIYWYQVAGIVRRMPNWSIVRSVKCETHKAMTLPLCS